MFAQIDTMRMARDLGAHAAQRQRVIATNVANADTPGYRTRDLPEFEDSLYRSGLDLRTTRAGHLGGFSGTRARTVEVEAEPSPNGNTVSLEDEMVRSADAKREFDLSLAVMQSGMNLMRTAIGRRG